jgi:autotransporter-associated beta strand protein
MLHKQGLAVLSAAIAGAVSTGRPAHAAIHSWIGTTSGDWSNPANWQAGNLPVSASDTLLRFLVPNGSITFNANNNVASPFDLNILWITNNSTQPQTISGGQLRFVKSGLQQETISLQGPASATATFGGMTIANDIITTGDLLISPTRNPGTFSGVISGAGRITVSINSGSVAFSGANSYSGGTVVRFSTLRATGSGNLGTGSTLVGTDEVLLNQLGNAWFDSAANVASGANSVHVGHNSYVQFNQLDADAMSKVNPRSKGYVVLGELTSVAPVLDMSNHPKMRIGTNLPNVNRGSFTLSSTIVPGRDQFRFGGQDVVTSDVNNTDSLVVTSPLNDGSLGQVRSVSIGSEITARGGKVVIANASNDYSGGTTVEPTALFTDINASLVFDYTPGPGQTPLGTGSLNVRGGALIFEGTFGAVGSLPNYINMEPGGKLLFNNAIGSGTTAIANNADRWGDSKPLDLDGTEFTLRAVGTHSETIGDVSYTEGNHIRVERTSNFGTVSLIVNSFNRTGRGTIQISPITTNQFGTTHSVQVLNSSSIVDATTGMVHPSIVAQRTGDTILNPGEFLQVVGGNLTPFAYVSSPNTATDTEVVSVASPTIGFFWGFPSETLWALRTGQASVTFGTGTLTIRSGGLIMAGSLNSSGTVHFNNNGTDVEGLIYVNDGTPSFAGTLSASVTTSAGITKFGEGDLWLNAANFFTGGLNINQGTVRVNNAGALNAASTNPVHVGFEGTLDLGGFNLTLPQLTGTGFVRSSFSGTTTLTVNATADHRFDGRLQGSTIQVLALTKTGGGEFTLGGFNRYHGMTSVQSGTLTLAGANLGVVFNDAGTLRYLYGDYTTSGGATLRVSSDHRVGNVLGGGDTYIGPDAELIAASIRQNLLDISSGGRATILPNGGSTATSRVTSLNLNNGTLDLNDNDLVVDYNGEESLDTIKSQIVAGRITSSAATISRGLGYADNTVTGYATFSGQSVDPTTVLVKYTWFGDTDLDGDVDVNDLGNLATNWQQAGVWTNGDFDRNDLVNVNDLGLLATNWQAGVGSPLGPSETRQPTLAGALAALGLPPVGVPEPAGFGLLLAGALKCQRRPRTRRPAP